MATKMDDYNQKYVQPVKNWWTALTPARKKQLMIFGPALLILLIGLVVWLNYKPYAVLYRNLDLAEAGRIMSSLEEKGISAETKNDGTILVPQDKVAALKMQLAMEGYPKSSLNYDFYIDNVDTMSTDSDRRTYKIYQLNNRLQESIKTINGVQDAIVTISVPENNGYVLKTDNSTATASVVVTMLGAESLSNAQVNGIKQLVSKGVVGMPSENVAVIDASTGEELGGDNNSLSGKASDRLAIEKEIDKTIEEKVQRQLQLLIGDEGSIQVVATSRINTDDMLTQSKLYTPMNEDSTTGVTSQESHQLESSDSGILAAGVPGAESNADSPNYPALNGEEEGAFFNQYQYDYKVNETLQEVQRGDIVLESLKVSVVIQSAKADDLDSDELLELVAMTANVETDDVYIYMQSTDGELEEGTPAAVLQMIQQNWWIFIIAAVLLILVAIIVIVLLRKKRQREIAEDLAAQEEARLAAETAAKSLAKANQPKMSEEEAKQQQILEQVKGFAKEHPDVAAQIIKGWLKGDE